MLVAAELRDRSMTEDSPVATVDALSSDPAATASHPIRRIGPQAEPWQPPAGTVPEYVHDQLLVKFSDQVSDATIDRVIAELGATLLRTYRAPGLVLLKLPATLSVAEAELQLSREQSVERVERDATYHLMDIPDDPRFGEMWGLDNNGQDGGVADIDINAPEAWIEVTGSRDFVIAVIDSGVDLDHPDLQANLWINSGEVADNGIDDDGNGYVDDIHGIDQIGFDGTPDDNHGHGSHVTGTIASVGDNGVGVAGVMWDAEVLSCKAFSSLGWTTRSRLLACFDYIAWAHDAGFDVVAINASWGGSGFSWLMHDAITELDQRDILLIASAGNSASDLDTFPVYPAAYEFDNIISVAAIDRHGALASFSNFGATSVDIAAPGVDVLSTERFDNWGYRSGTSMAAPHVTGAVGLLKASAPSMSNTEIREFLLANGEPDPAMAGITSSGRRLRLNLPFIDLDADLISDRWERRHGLDPADPSDALLDPDGDGLDNLAEFNASLDPNDADTDDDTLNDGDELNIHGTNPLSADTDGDDLDDAQEVQVTGTDPNLPDTDADGLSDAIEINDTATNPLVADTDGDGLLDGFEVAHGFDPFVPGEQGLDVDADGLDALAEQGAGTNPLIADTDGDALVDGDEVNTHATNPLDRDTDGDTIDDAWEVSNGLDALASSDQRLDPDTDGYTNQEEYLGGGDPQDAGNVPPEQAFSGFQGNARQSGFVATHTNAADFRPRWLLNLPGNHTSNVPVATRHHTYAGPLAGQPRSFGAYDMVRGKLLWEADTAHIQSMGVPIVWQDSLIMTSENSQTGELQLVSLDRFSGAPRFAPVILGNLGGAAGLAVDDGDVFLRAPDRVFRFDAATGAEIWQAPFPQTNLFEKIPVAVGRQYVVVATNDKATILNRNDGTVADEVTMPRCPLDIKQVAIDRDDNAYVLCSFRLYRVGLDDGIIDWEVIGPRTVAEFTLGVGYVYVSTFNDVVALDLESGNEIWRWRTPGFTSGNIVSSLDHLFVEVFMNDPALPNPVFAIDLGTHQPVWQSEVPGILALNDDGALVMQPETSGIIQVIDTRGDLDGDGMPDWFERYHGFSTTVAADAAGDADADGLTNLDEYLLGSGARNADSDADGLTDGDEINTHGTNPLVSDSDGDGLTDGDELNVYMTSPTSSDSDGDGFHDGDEVDLYASDPGDPNSVPDLLLDFFESFESTIPAAWANGAGATHAFERRDTDATDGSWSLVSPTVNRDESVAFDWPANFAEGQLTFDYRIAGRVGQPSLEVYVDGASHATLRGNDWESVRIGVPRGTRMVRFEFDSSIFGDSHQVYLDNIRFQAAPAYGANVDNVLVVQGNRLWEFRPDGTEARSSMAIPNALEARDLVVTHDHRIAIADAPYVHIYDPVLRRFSRTEIESWSPGYNARYSPIAAHGDKVLISDLRGSFYGSLHVLDKTGRLAEQTIVADTYVALHVGQDGFLYGQPNFDGRYERLDPNTYQLLHSGRISNSTIGSIAVDDSGRFYASDRRRLIERRSEAGDVLDELWLNGAPNPHDIALSERGLLFSGSNGVLIVTEQDFDGAVVTVPVAFQNTFNDSVWVTHIPSAGPDTDGDTMPDWWERVHGLDMRNPADATADPDVDGLDNAAEFAANGNPHVADTDGDGLDDGDEAQTWASSVTRADSDRDGLDDYREALELGTDPAAADTDGDGLDDGLEVLRFGSNPLNPDSDNDGLTDGVEFNENLSLDDASDAMRDADADGLSNAEELAVGTDLRNWDTDRDGLADGEDISIGANPTSADSDGDRIYDGWEYRNGLDPLMDDAAGDADGDGFDNASEYFAMSDPQSAASIPVPAPWRTDQGTAQHAGFVPVRLDPAAFSVSWTVPRPPDETALGETSIGRDQLFVTQPRQFHPGDRTLKTFDRWTGALAWQNDFNAADDLTGPAIDADTVYVQSRHRTDGDFVWGLDQATGSVRFQTTYRGRGTASRAPVVADGMLYTTSNEGVARYDTATGSEQWHTETSFHDSPASPALSGRHVYIYSAADEMLNVIDRETGLAGYAIRVERGTGMNGMVSSPIVDRHGNLIFLRNAGYVSVSPQERTINWSTPTFTLNNAALGNGMLYSVEPNALLAMDARDGEIQWTWPIDRPFQSNVLLTLDHVFVANDVETRAIDLVTRGEVWAYPLGGQLSMSEDQVLYIAGHYGDIAAISTQPDTDGDHIPDTWEQVHGFNANDDADGETDVDADGLTQRDEYLHRSNPNNPDSDGDGLADGSEIGTYGTVPTNADTDGDGLDDLAEVSNYGSDPRLTDSDGDGLPDAREALVLGTSAVSIDSDGDGWRDDVEIGRASDPASAASQPGVVSEFFESFENGRISPRFTNGSDAHDRWEVTDEGQAADGRYFVRPKLVELGKTAELVWDDNFAAGVLTYEALNDDLFLVDALEVYLDGNLVETISRDIDWTPHFIELDAGRHEVRWRLVRRRSGLTEPLRLFVDKIRFANADGDDDGMPTVWELTYGLDPEDPGDANRDDDGDTLTNIVEFGFGSSPISSDTDSDGMPDNWEFDFGFDPAINDAGDDADNDNLTNGSEFTAGTLPNDPDSDADGMPDGWEVANALDPLSNDASGDADGDTLTNIVEFGFGTSPISSDTDGDGMPDDWEVAHALDPLNNDASGDADGDGTTNFDEYSAGTDPRDANSVPGGGGGSGGGSGSGGGGGGGACDPMWLLLLSLTFTGHRLTARMSMGSEVFVKIDGKQHYLWRKGSKKSQ